MEVVFGFLPGSFLSIHRGDFKWLFVLYMHMFWFVQGPHVCTKSILPWYQIQWSSCNLLSLWGDSVSVILTSLLTRKDMSKLSCLYVPSNPDLQWCRVLLWWSRLLLITEMRLYFRHSFSNYLILGPWGHCWKYRPLGHPCIRYPHKNPWEHQSP